MESKVNLYINYYFDKNPERQVELDECLRRNCENPLISKIWCLCEDKLPPSQNGHGKIVEVVNVERGRPTFEDFFRTMRLVGDGNTVHIVANSDIYFDESLELLDKKDGNGTFLLNEHTAYCLSRWDVQEDGTSVHFNRRDSYDTYVFRGKIKPVTEVDFTMGVAGCDDVLAHRLHKAGYGTYNPSKSIKTHHLHLTGVRNYLDEKGEVTFRLPPPYRLITPTELL